MKITRRQLRQIIKEVSDTVANSEGVGDKAIRTWLMDDLLEKNGEMEREEVLKQAEGAGFESELVEETIDEMIAAGELIDDNDKLELN